MAKLRKNPFAEWLGANLFPEEIVKPGKKYVGIHVPEDSEYRTGFEPSTRNLILARAKLDEIPEIREDIEDRVHTSPDPKYKYLIDVTDLEESVAQSVMMSLNSVNGVFPKLFIYE